MADHRQDLIGHYFAQGFSNLELLVALELSHGINISQRQLKRDLQHMNLYRRKHQTAEEDIINFLQMQIASSGHLHGYRWMHQKCVLHGITASLETIRILLKQLDPRGVEARSLNRLIRRQYQVKGPNYLWHIDGYDKLKKYGIAIHGCIDGYSRYIVWLEAYTTNNDPQVIGGYYITAIHKREGCPRIVRADFGTENGHVATIQRFLRRNGIDVFSGDKSFMYGKSSLNQRIEQWWSTLRKENIQFWMDLLEQLTLDGYFDGTYLDKALMQFCFMKLIQVVYLTWLQDLLSII